MGTHPPPNKHSRPLPILTDQMFPGKPERLRCCNIPPPPKPNHPVPLLLNAIPTPLSPNSNQIPLPLTNNKVCLTKNIHRAVAQLHCSTLPPITIGLQYPQS